MADKKRKSAKDRVRRCRAGCWEYSKCEYSKSGAFEYSKCDGFVVAYFLPGIGGYANILSAGPPLYWQCVEAL